ncbi:hypothetical protein NDU88_006749 [Pleurodeles waltl]|uniref:Uncharacterized protein n=1 Tax=Pleurodeles waltl TaxID=8319 RepID=A0AAV7ULX1_PLEWA|nr:hypothetical protein NDU88_006749 [Pleurodeles waltl]
MHGPTARCTNLAGQPPGAALSAIQSSPRRTSAYSARSPSMRQRQASRQVGAGNIGREGGLAAGRLHQSSSPHSKVRPSYIVAAALSAFHSSTGPAALAPTQRDLTVYMTVLGLTLGGSRRYWETSLPAASISLRPPTGAATSIFGHVAPSTSPILHGELCWFVTSLGQITGRWFDLGQEPLIHTSAMLGTWPRPPN